MLLILLLFELLTSRYSGAEGISGLPGAFHGAANGGLPPPFPGSGGWITAENVGDYFDADGNWIGGEDEQEPLGEGAGRARGRDEVEAEDEKLTNGHGTEDGDEHKRPRTE
jgi:nucleotide-sensitive chloride channel 1A